MNNEWINLLHINFIILKSYLKTLSLILLLDYIVFRYQVRTFKESKKSYFDP